ncbi:MAG: tRNA epoxyqueuosine(34) reductase QueG, partial [Ignavibacteria bacterium]|nr:tRNA epoxyqueuosine(34) reductase QueG [Ignavibacteria bacterium]
MSNLSEIIRQKAHEVGFDLVGFTKADLLSVEGQKLAEWIDKNYHAEMHWIKRTFQKRISPYKILEEAKSVIALGLNYYQKGEFSNKQKLGKISRYAWGEDYHHIIEKKMKILIEFINELQPNSKNISYVDYGPTMDKAWAVRSGLGWMGKHTVVINTSLGSWFFIGIIISSMELDKYDEPIQDLCGACNICIEACPTN